MYSKLFWKDAAERAISTMAQALLAISGVDGLNLANIDVRAILVGTLIAGILSVLKSIVALQTTTGNSASLVVDNVKQK